MQNAISVVLAGVASISLFACRDAAQTDMSDAVARAEAGSDAKDGGGESRPDVLVDAPMTCTFVDAYICTYCGSGSLATPPSDLAVGCRAEQDCKIFCSATMPPDFMRCPYRGPDDSPAPCRGWQAPRPPLSICEKKTNYGHIGTAYSCPSCFSVPQTPTAAVGPDQTCYVFVDGCTPDGFAPSSGCVVPSP